MRYEPRILAEHESHESQCHGREASTCQWELTHVMCHRRSKNAIKSEVTASHRLAFVV